MSIIRSFFNRYRQVLLYLFKQKLTVSEDQFKIKIKDKIIFISQKDSDNYKDAALNSPEYNPIDIANQLHPLFYTRISWNIIENLNDHLEVPINEKILDRIIHTSEQIIYYKKFKIPDEIRIKSKIWETEAHKQGTKILIKFDYFSYNELVATEFSGGLLFGEYLKNAKPKRKSKSKKASTKNVKPVWKRTIKIPEHLPYTYAKNAVIDSPIHTKPQFAQSLGFPGVLLQGTCTLAKSVNLIYSELIGYKAVQLKSVSAKFTGVIVPPDVITVRILRNEEKIFIFDVLNGSGKAVIKGGKIEF